MPADRTVAWVAAGAAALAALWVVVGPVLEGAGPHRERVGARDEAERTVRSQVQERLGQGFFDARQHARRYFEAALDDARLLAPFAELVAHPPEKPEPWDQVLSPERYHFYLRAGPEGGRCQALFDRLVREQVDGESSRARRVQWVVLSLAALQVALVWTTLLARHRSLGARLACAAVLLLGAWLAWVGAAGVTEARGGVETLLLWAPGEAAVLVFCLLFWREATGALGLWLAGAAVLGLAALGGWAYVIGSAY